MRRDGGRLARVVSVGRNAAWISFEDETTVRLAALRKNAEQSSLVPGDLVRAQRLEDERVVVEGREPRTFALRRTTAGGRTKTMAANVDGIAIVAAFARPAMHLAMIDELVAFAELHELTARLFFTKADLAPDAGVDPELVPALYRGLGYLALVVDPRDGRRSERVAEALGSSHSLLIGQSGVGKSSLFTTLGGSGEVGDVSKIGRGKQTTTTGRLHRFPNGFLIDSPGFGEFELEDVGPSELVRGFVEFGEPAERCRFTDCRHREEPGCGVLAALGAGRIAASRYESYRGILARQATARNRG